MPGWARRARLHSSLSRAKRYAHGENTEAALPHQGHSTIRLSTGGLGRLKRGSALHALDVPVHHQHVSVLHLLAFRDALLAGLIGYRAGEYLVASVLRAGDDLVGGGAHVFRHGLAVGRHGEDSLLEPPPRVVRLPSAVEHRLGARDVIGTPEVKARRQMRLRRK